MKTTIEIPDPLLRRAKSKAAERGQSLKDFLTDALREKLAVSSGASVTGAPVWMRGFGKLSPLRKETARIQARIDAAFEAVEGLKRESW